MGPKKTNKASMLDEAIVYLKQLQLQVQVKARPCLPVYMLDDNLGTNLSRCILCLIHNLINLSDFKINNNPRHPRHAVLLDLLKFIVRKFIKCVSGTMWRSDEANLRPKRLAS